jgi:transposase
VENRLVRNSILSVNIALHTDRFAEMIVQQVIHSDLHNEGQQNDLTDEEVWSIVEYISKKKLVIDLTGLQRLGMDEIALHKGENNYITILVDLDRRVPVGFVVSRKHKDIKEVLKGRGQAVLNQIIEVSIDLSGNYRGLVQKMMPSGEDHCRAIPCHEAGWRGVKQDNYQGEKSGGRDARQTGENAS